MLLEETREYSGILSLFIVSTLGSRAKGKRDKEDEEKMRNAHGNSA